MFFSNTDSLIWWTYQSWYYTRWCFMNNFSVYQICVHIEFKSKSCSRFVFWINFLFLYLWIRYKKIQLQGSKRQRFKFHLRNYYLRILWHFLNEFEFHFNGWKCVMATSKWIWGEHRIARGQTRYPSHLLSTKSNFVSLSKLFHH